MSERYNELIGELKMAAGLVILIDVGYEVHLERWVKWIKWIKNAAVILEISGACSSVLIIMKSFQSAQWISSALAFHTYQHSHYRLQAFLRKVPYFLSLSIYLFILFYKLNFYFSIIYICNHIIILLWVTCSRDMYAWILVMYSSPHTHLFARITWFTLLLVAIQRGEE